MEVLDAIFTSQSVLVFSAVIIVMYYYNKKEAIGCPKVDRTIARLDGHLPIIGSVLFPMEQLTDKFVEFLNANPETRAHVATYPFNNPVIWITDQKVIEYVTVKNFDNYIKGEFLSERLQDVLGNGIFKF
jgi:hypothetical protein